MQIDDVMVIRSNKRRKTVSAKLRSDGVLEVRAPMNLKERELEEIIRKLRTRIERRVDSAERERTDDALEKRARELNDELFDGRLTWSSIRYADNQEKRWGSCTSTSGTIRLSSRLRSLPTWVRDYVLIHEMAHLEEPNHSSQFWALCNRYALTERARGYLMAVDHMQGRDDTLNEC